MANHIPPRLEATLGDLTRESLDAVVNAANEKLARGGGVCGAILAAAGPGLAEACADVAPCPTCDARTTGVFGYPLEVATEIAVRTVATTPTAVERVRFVCFDAPTLAVYERALSAP
ncbi:MAG: macro domain-containing protein [Actinomycetota bacterium]